MKSEFYVIVFLYLRTRLEDSPEKINEDPYGDGWILKLRVSGENDLLSAEEYEKALEEEA